MKHKYVLKNSYSRMLGLSPSFEIYTKKRLNYVKIRFPLFLWYLNSLQVCFTLTIANWNPTINSFLFHKFMTFMCPHAHNLSFVRKGCQPMVSEGGCETVKRILLTENKDEHSWCTMSSV